LARVDGQIWLCDVGFAGPGFRWPLPLVLEQENVQLGESFMILKDPEYGYLVQKKIQDIWRPLYSFIIEPARKMDIEIAHFFTSQNPEYIFRKSIIGTRVTANGRVTLSNFEFKHWDLLKHQVSSQTFEASEAYWSALQQNLGIDLSPVERQLFHKHLPKILAP